MHAAPHQPGEILYRNPLREPSDVAGFRLEGEAMMSFPNGCLRLENAVPPSEGQKSNFVLWCPEVFPDCVAFSWDFTPLREPGLVMFFFAAAGRRGEDLFDPALAPRTGLYGQYHSSDIDTLHASYFRRRGDGIHLHVCNLRKSFGFHLVGQGPDPIPSAAQARGPYRIRIVKAGPRVAMSVNELTVFDWQDDGRTYGPVLGGGRIGFRQMAPLAAEYADLTVERVGPGG